MSGTATAESDQRQLRARGPGAGYLLLFFAAATVLIDAVYGTNLIRQAWSTHYPAVEATISRSNVYLGRSYRGRRPLLLDLEYIYSINGREYRGTCYRYDLPTPTGWRAKSLAASYPVGSAIQIHLNETDPSDAVMSAGLDGDGIGFCLGIFMPLHLATFGLGALVIHDVRARRREELRLGMRVSRQRGTVCLRPPLWPGPVVGGFAASVAGFLVMAGGAAINEGNRVVHAPLIPMLTAGAGAIALGVAAGIAALRTYNPGMREISVNQNERLMRLAAWQGESAIVIHADDIQRIDVVGARAHRPARRRRTGNRFHLDIRYRAAGKGRVVVAWTGVDSDFGERAAAYLRNQLGVAESHGDGKDRPE